MIESIIITDLSTAVSLSFKEIKQNAWISAVDEEDRNKIRSIKKNFEAFKKKHFVQYFYDWSDEDKDPYIIKNIEEQGPTEQHVNNIISFIEPLAVSSNIYHLGVNCFAGVSRSTAIGLIAWVLQGRSPVEALDEIIKARYQAWPNLRILRLASEILGKDLATPVKQWKQHETNHIFYEPKDQRIW